MDRILEIQPTLNAMVDQRLKSALEESRRVDRILGSLQSPALEELARESPLLGVPFSTKDGLKVQGGWIFGQIEQTTLLITMHFFFLI